MDVFLTPNKLFKVKLYVCILVYSCIFLFQINTHTYIYINTDPYKISYLKGNKRKLKRTKKKNENEI